MKLMEEVVVWEWWWDIGEDYLVGPSSSSLLLSIIFTSEKFEPIISFVCHFWYYNRMLSIEGLLLVLLLASTTGITVIGFRKSS